MTQFETNGFDVVTEVAESELNTQIAELYYTGELMPPEVPLKIQLNVHELLTLTAKIHLMFSGPPDLNLNTERENGVDISLQFAESSIEVTGVPGRAEDDPIVISGLAGLIDINSNVEVVRNLDMLRVVLDLRDLNENDVNVTFNAASEVEITNVINAIPDIPGEEPITFADVTGLIKSEILNHLKNTQKEIVIIEDLIVYTDDDPFHINDLDVKVINDQAHGISCLAFLIRTSSSTSGNSAAFTECLIPTGSQSTIIFSNDLLVRRIICPEVASSFQIGVSDFDEQCNLMHEVPTGTEGVTLKTLSVAVSESGDYVKIVGTARKSGNGYVANVSFEARVFFDLEGNDIVLRVEKDDPEIDIDISWWLWILGVATGGFIFGSMGVAIAAVLIAVVDAIADRVISGFLNYIITDELENVNANIPLGPIGNGLNIDNIILDDLALIGSPFHSSRMPIKSQSDDRVLELGQVFDLDNGGVLSTGADILWSVGMSQLEIKPQGGARLIQLSSDSFQLLSFLDIYNKDYRETCVLSQTSVPIGTPDNPPKQPLMFAVRTDEKRYAKCAVWREDSNSNKLHIRYITYDVPMPSVKLTSAQKITNRENSDLTVHDLPGGVGTTFGCTVEMAFHVMSHATPVLMAHPIKFEWYVGESLIEGNGSIIINDIELKYEVNNERCDLCTELGNSLETELSVIAVDKKGIEKSDCVPISIVGSVHQRSTVPGPAAYAGHYGDLPRVEHGGKPEVKVKPEWDLGPEHEFRGQFEAGLEKGMNLKIRDL